MNLKLLLIIIDYLKMNYGLFILFERGRNKWKIKKYSISGKNLKEY